MSESSQHVLCPRCQAEIGVLVDCNGLPLLRIGGGLCRDWHGVCAQCGQVVHWSRSALLLERIVKRAEQGY